MKKYLLILGMITCFLGLTACGSDKEEVEETFMTEDEASYSAQQILSSIIDIVASGQQEMYLSQDESLEPYFTSWENAVEELGDYKETVDSTTKFDGDQAVVTLSIVGTELNPKGEERTADVEVIFDKKDGLTGFAANVKYTTGEQMTKAGLNTLLGMGTVFVILILIALIISLFAYIPKLQKMFSKKDKADAKEKAVDNTIAQIIENEELSDDTELVAVIAAAIAASEGAASTDGFVVRSIKRANTNKWQRA